jgi:hypothetical protein
MKVDEFAGLDALVQRLREKLWRQRIKRGAAYGLAVSGLLLLLAGITHLALMPVTVAVWLPLATAPPLLGAVVALVWQRPGAASVVALFDRAGAYEELLLSGWEAYNTPARQRSAGAVAVLRQAAAEAADSVVPATWASQQLRLRWLPVYTAVVWVMFLSGLFALQLPPQSTAGPPPASAAAGERDAVAAVALTSTRKLATSPTEQLPKPDPVALTNNPEIADSSLAPATQGGTPPRRITSEEAQASTAPEAADAGGSQAFSDSVAAAGVGAASGTAGDAAAATTDGASGNAGEEAERGLPEEPFELQVRYADIARQIAAQVNQTIAGSGSIAFAETGSSESARGPAPGGELDLQLTAVPYSTRFSPSQRAQITAYFKYLETLP